MKNDMTYEIGAGAVALPRIAPTSGAFQGRSVPAAVLPTGDLRITGGGLGRLRGGITLAPDSVARRSVI